MSLEDDLARWEAGYLSREALIASYASNEKNRAEPLEKNLDKNLVPGGDPESTIVDVIDLHERLIDIGSEPVLYLESDWAELRDSLPDKLPRRRVFGGGRLARPFIAASMVVGLTAGAAAASPTVREHMVSVWHGIQHIAVTTPPSPIESRTPITGSPHAPGDRVGGDPVGSTGAGNLDENPGNSDGTPGGGNTGSPGNSDGTPGGGNTGSPGNSDGTPGGGNWGNPGENPDENSGNGGGNSGENPDDSGETPGDSGEDPGNGGDPGNGNSGT